MSTLWCEIPHVPDLLIFHFQKKRWQIGFCWQIGGWQIGGCTVLRFVFFNAPCWALEKWLQRSIYKVSFVNRRVAIGNSKEMSLKLTSQEILANVCKNVGCENAVPFKKIFEWKFGKFEKHYKFFWGFFSCKIVGIKLRNLREEATTWNFDFELSTKALVMTQKDQKDIF